MNVGVKLPFLWHLPASDWLDLFSWKQRERKRRNSDRSEDGYHSDGDYPDQDYRREPGEEKKSKTIMLWGLSPHVTEDDVSLPDCFSDFMFPTPSLNNMLQKWSYQSHLLCLLDLFCHWPTRGTSASGCEADEKENRWETNTWWIPTFPQSLTIGPICFRSDPFPIAARRRFSQVT